MPRAKTSKLRDNSDKHSAGIDKQIIDLMTKRKLQQDALAKIKASVEERQSDLRGQGRPSQKNKSL